MGHDGGVTPVQTAALEPLTERQRRFVVALVGDADGVLRTAAIAAGYAPHTAANHASRIAATAHVAHAIEVLRAPGRRSTVMDLDEIREMWTAVARGQLGDLDDEGVERPAGLPIRLRALESLARSLGAFVERVEIRSASVQLQITAGDAERILALTAGVQI